MPCKPYIPRTIPWHMLLTAALMAALLALSACGGSGGGSNSKSTKTTASVPDTPILTATLKNNAITLHWGKVSGATTYRVFRDENGESTAEIAITSATEYTDTAVQPGATYTYRITACNTQGCSTPQPPKPSPFPPAKTNPRPRQT